MGGNPTAEAESDLSPSVAPVGYTNPLTYTPRLVKAFAPVEVCGRTLKVYGLFKDPARRSTVPEPDWIRRQASLGARQNPCRTMTIRSVS